VHPRIGPETAIPCGTVDSWLPSPTLIGAQRVEVSGAAITLQRLNTGHPVDFISCPAFTFDINVQLLILQFLIV
jgi:hypothetical protein